jgi:hypothetical protein
VKTGKLKGKLLFVPEAGAMWQIGSQPPRISVDTQP